MGKKPRKGQKRSQNKPPKKRKIFLLLIVGVISVTLVILVLSGHLPFQIEISKKGKSFYVKGGETRPVLSPSLFVGMASEAYAAAREYPKVMDEVFCYCKCDEPPTLHKSLLSCFTDKHGEGWLLCQKEALRAAQLYKDGKNIEDIKRAIDKEFAG